MIYQRPSTMSVRDREIAAMPIVVEPPAQSWLVRHQYMLTGLLVVIVTIWSVAR